MCRPLHLHEVPCVRAVVQVRARVHEDFVRRGTSEDSYMPLTNTLYVHKVYGEEYKINYACAQ